MSEGLPLSRTGHREAGGKLYFQTNLLDVNLPAGLPQGKADNQILGVVQALRESEPKRDVTLVSKDINMRIKARALGLPAEDYYNDKTLEDGDLLYTGVLQLPADFWDRHGKTMESWSQGGLTYYRISGPLVPALLINQFVYFEAPGAAPLYAKVTEITGKTAVLRTLREYTHNKNAVWGVTARNREQNFALNLLMDPECDFITLTGTAGHRQDADDAGRRPVAGDGRPPLHRDHRDTRHRAGGRGHRLPARHRGREDEPMDGRARRQPRGAVQERRRRRRMGPRGDQRPGAQQDQDQEPELHARPHVPQQVRDHRRGAEPHAEADEDADHARRPGTKIVCLGNLAQIDTPYLTEGSSGLTYAVDRFKGWPHSGHVTLARGERSRLADFASEVL
jgi:PhoH-like ATPase